MSWLNNSLNTIKGQLTTLAQEVLSETAGPGDDEYRGDVDTRTAVELLAATEKEKEELDKVCRDKDNEIAALRKQIGDLQSKISTPGDSSSLNTAPEDHSNAATTVLAPSLEDSWCWELGAAEAGDAEPTTLRKLASTSAAEHEATSDASSSSNGNSEMINITLKETPLAHGGSDSGSGSSKSGGRRVSEKAAALQRRNAQLTQENAELRSAMDELDRQHELAMQNVLEVKTTLQGRVQTLTQDLETVQRQHAEDKAAISGEQVKLREQLEALQTTQQTEAKEHEALRTQHAVDAAELRRTLGEVADLQVLLEKKTHDNMELIERIKTANGEVEQAVAERQELKQRVEKLDTLLEKRMQDNKELTERIKTSDGETEQATAEREQLKERVAELQAAVQEAEVKKAQKTSESSTSTSKGGGGNNSEEDEFIVVGQGDANSGGSATATPPTKELLRDKIVELEGRVAELTLENSSLASRLQDADSKNATAATEQREKLDSLEARVKATAELEQRLLLAEREKESLQLELQAQRQQLTLENQQLRLDAEAETEQKLNNSAELEQQLQRLREENEQLRNEVDNIVHTRFRQAIEEEKQTITDLDDDDEMDTFTLQRLREVLAAALQRELQRDDDGPEDELAADKLERTYKLLRERLWCTEALEKNVHMLTEEVQDLQQAQRMWEHAKSTLEADISQYVLQCDELMKNNEILLNELENYKRNKLATIHEHNEENVLQLEAQLDECETVQRTLEQEYATLSAKLADAELERNEAVQQLQEAQQRNETLSAEQRDMRLQLDTLELEKSNLQFELNEANAARTDAECADAAEARAALEAAEERCGATERQLECLSKDHGDLVEALVAQKAALGTANAKCETLEAELAAVREQLRTLEQQEEQHSAGEHGGAIARIAELEAQLLASADLAKAVEALNYEKGEMLKALQQKHAENTQYYVEIQRLQALSEAPPPACAQCPTLEAANAELRGECEKQRDQVNFLKEKSDILTTNLLTEQTNQRLVLSEKVEAEEQNAGLRRDLERLRAHLLEIEEQHTQETVQLQRDLDAAKTQMVALQEDVAKSSTAYTSASIRANQHAETLQAQHALVVQQRDELLIKLSAAEDRESKNQAALCNLQCALEQFQNDKEHDIHTATQRIRKELQIELAKQTQLQQEISGLNQQLADANEGLRAASRISDQLEASQQTVAALREEVELLKQQKQSLLDKLDSSESSQSDKIEKSLIKSLVIGYVVSSNPNDKQQLLRMISSVLDFSHTETDRVGLNKQHTSWLGAILGGGSGNGGGAHTQENLMQAFVQFLEQESQPKVDTPAMPNLLNITQSASTSATNAASTAALSSNTSPSGDGGGIHSPPGTANAPYPIQPLMLNSNVLNEFAPTRNSSSILKDILSDS